MDTNTQIINPLNIPEWDDLVLEYPDYSLFHTSAWIKTITETYNYKPQFFVVGNNNSIRAIVPLIIVNSHLTGNRAISLPFSDYCEPLIPKDINFNDLFNQILDFSKTRKLKFVELRGGQKHFKDVAASTFDYLHKLDLKTGEENILKKFSSNTKRNIKKAEREKIVVSISNSYEAIEDFYQMNCVTRKKHGLPPQPKKFFINLYKNLLEKQKGFTAIANHDGIPIAGAVYFLVGKKAIYKFGASYMEYQNLRANNIVMWTAIKHCINKGYEEFCFGRTEPENEGLRKFKLGWGTTEEVNNTYRYDNRKNSFVSLQTKTIGAHTRIFTNTPLPLLKLFGSVLYRHFG
jgi:CelD/BcsL family acetyltransferase involved in cellulose biosynthesis